MSTDRRGFMKGLMAAVTLGATLGDEAGHAAKAEATRRFDFGPNGRTAAATGYAAVGPGDTFTAKRGWGWVETAGLDARDRSAPDDVRRDFVFSAKPGTFRIAGLAAGNYRLSIVAGDLLYGDHTTQVRVAGAQTMPLLNPVRASFATLTAIVPVGTSGILDIVLEAPRVTWTVNALTLEPAGGETPAATAPSVTMAAVTPPEPKSSWEPVLKWPDPTRDLLDGHRKRMREAKAFTATGLARADYLRLITGEVDFWKTKQNADGAIIDPYRNVEFQYSTPAFAHAAAALVAWAGRKDLLEAAAKALDWSAWTLAERKAASGHEDFFAPMLAHAIPLLQPLVPAERFAKWAADIGRFDPFTTYRAAPGSSNWNVVALAGEGRFQQLGLRDKKNRFVEVSLAAQGHVFGTPYGLFLEGPMPYDHFPRLWAADLIAHGYDGAYHQELAEVLRRAAITSLFMQSPWGELPAGGRSAQHQWNEAEQAVTYEIYAARVHQAGDDLLAGVYKRAAHLALRSMFRWQRPSGEMQIIKNWVDPEKAHAFEGYSAHSQYNLLPMSMLALAYEHAETTETIAEKPAPADVGGFVVNIEPLHKVFANAGGTYIEVETNADHGYDATGLIRAHFAGISPQIGLTDSLVAHPHYRVPAAPTPAAPTTGAGVAWQLPNGTWHYFGDTARAALKKVTVNTEAADAGRVALRIRWEGNLPGGISRVEERYVLTPGRLEVTTTLPGFTGQVRRVVPVLVDDGRAKSSVLVQGQTVTVSQADTAGSAQTFTAVDASAVRVSDTAWGNHNGWAALLEADYPVGAGAKGIRLVIAPK